MLRKVFAFIAAVMLICLSGCSKYVMTEEDLKLQKSLEGYWAADVDTDYNVFDENGSLVEMTIIEFTEDFHYIMHKCLLDEGYALSYPPVAYSFEEQKFKVVTEGVPSFARVSVVEDGQIMYWYTDEKTDTYRRIDKETAAALGVPEYSAESWVTDENGDYIGDSSAADTQPSDTEADEAAGGGETEMS